MIVNGKKGCDLQGLCHRGNIPLLSNFCLGCWDKWIHGMAQVRSMWVKDLLQKDSLCQAFTKAPRKITPQSLSRTKSSSISMLNSINNVGWQQGDMEMIDWNKNKDSMGQMRQLAPRFKVYRQSIYT